MLTVQGLRVTFEGKSALDDVSLDVEDGEVVAVLGPSGSGKTTLLRAIVGLQPVEAGSVLLDGRDLAPVPVHRRGIGLVFQDQALFHHRDVGRNVAFGLEMQGANTGEMGRRVGEALERVGLGGYERRQVSTLSGGEQQRVALARALAPEPRVLLLDEPLGSLDRPLRERLLDDLAALFDALDATVLHVTHDHGEAFRLGDRVAVMHEGRIVQVGGPDELWASPADAWTARFLGMANVDEDRVVRPEAVGVRVAPEGGDGVVESAVRSGATVRLRVQLDDGGTLETVLASVRHPQPGDRVAVSIDPEGIVELR